jgi:signal peptidase I
MLPTYTSGRMPETELEAKPDLDIKKVLRDSLQILVFSGLLFLLIKTVSIQIRVESVSMEPTLYPGDYVFVLRQAYIYSSLERGDVIVFDFPPDPTQQYIKRLIGLPGEEIFISHGVVAVDRSPLDEPYLKAPPLYSSQWEVPAGSYFVLGDNRNHSSDSHVWGMVPESHIRGKAIFIYWPLTRAGWIQDVAQ